MSASCPAWLAALQPILDSVSIESPTCFMLAGTRIDAMARPAPSPDDDFFDPDPLMRTLHRRLYAAFHAGAAAAEDPPKARETFIMRLSEANAGRDRLEQGWTVIETLASGVVVAQKGYRTRRWTPGEFLSESAPARPVRKTPIKVQRRREARALQESFYFAFGSATEDEYERVRSVRYYLNIAADAAVDVVGLLTSAFGRRAIPFACKCANSPGGFERRDPCVLYIGARHAQLAHFVLEALQPLLAPLLRPAVPILTQTLAPGLAFAEEPAGADSFGGHRMRAVAHGLIAAHRNGRCDEAGRRAALLESFSAFGIDLEAPHLVAGTGDPFGLRRLVFADAG
ncbi:T3SS effector HopA1 family protein [Sphingosinicella sp. BN140058]|uniref:T3SS effector HopA1 family protein n=1 Tax=Sphingosinicella sp. BN140058 TaxID=1892855 RepID=UPI0010135760|nr:T3SS effector HopA1 family protein [Sphingosinicella sp. BN140058]QAY78209.1 hypothetical protein ETR14_17985 [Sphingosinicella sp. BN140058]